MRVDHTNEFKVLGQKQSCSPETVHSRSDHVSIYWGNTAIIDAKVARVLNTELFDEGVGKLACIVHNLCASAIIQHIL